MKGRTPQKGLLLVPAKALPSCALLWQIVAPKMVFHLMRDILSVRNIVRGFLFSSAYLNSGRNDA